MAKIGANDPCPCASGLKYKRCCRDWHERAEAASRRVFTNMEALNAADDLLDTLSNTAVDLREAGDLDAAERTCGDLLQQCPDADDAYWRLAQVREARGDLVGALDAWRKVRGFQLVCGHITNPDPSWIEETEGHIARLERESVVA